MKEGLRYILNKSIHVFFTPGIHCFEIQEICLHESKVDIINCSHDAVQNTNITNDMI